VAQRTADPPRNKALQVATELETLQL